MSKKSRNKKDLTIINNLHSKKNNNQNSTRISHTKSQNNAHSSKSVNSISSSTGTEYFSACSFDSLEVFNSRSESQENSTLSHCSVSDNLSSSKKHQIDEVGEVLSKLQKVALEEVEIPHMQLLEVNKMCRVAIKHINTFNDMYVLVLNERAKQFYMDWGDMNNYYEENHANVYLSVDFFEQIYQTHPLYLVVGLVRDDKPRLWFRSKIMNFLEDGQFELLLIDFGETVQQPKLDCRVLTGEFKFPIAMQKVSLNVHFTEEKNDLFKAIVNSSTVPSVGNIYDMIPVDQFADNWFSVVLTDKYSGVNMNKLFTDREDTGASETGDDQRTEDSIDLWDPMRDDFESERNDYHIRTDDALFAVTGYLPNDDKIYCKFEDKCWKKFCHRRHRKLDPNGVTRDEEQVIFKSYSSSVKLVVHTNIKIKVTHVDENSLGDFYAHIVDDEVKESQEDEAEADSSDGEQREETLDSLSAYLMMCSRSLDKKQILKRLVVPPVDQQVVIVFYEGKYYRARVIHSFDEIDKYRVQFVDYGFVKTVLLKDLRQMEGKFNWLPYQAVHFAINNFFSFNIYKLKQEYPYVYGQCVLLLKHLLLSHSVLVGNVLLDKTIDKVFTTVHTTQGKDLIEFYLENCNRVFKANLVDGMKISDKPTTPSKDPCPPGKVSHSSCVPG